MLSVKNTADAVSIRLEPNRSASWKQTRLAIICLSGFMLLIGMGWLLMGVWLIFPFVILDIAIFSYFFYRVCESTYAAEIITIDSSSVTFKSGIRKIGTVKTLKRPCYFVVHPSASTGHLPRFSISDDDVSVEVGSFLSEHDKLRLKRIVTDLGLLEINELWWKTQKLINQNSF